MRKRLVMFVSVAAVVCFGTAEIVTARQRPAKVAVYVVAQPGEGGFVGPGVPDSVRDLKSEIPKRSSLRLASTADEADIILRVVDRRKVDGGPAGFAAFPIGSAVVAVPLEGEGNLLSTVMEIGDYRRPFQARFSGIGGVWKECAEQLSKQLHEWVIANREQIASRSRPR